MSIILMASLAMVAGQINPATEMLAKHAAALNSAESLSVSFTVALVPAAPQDYKLVYQKPDRLLIEGPHGTVMTDGKNVWEYTKSTNEYVVSEGSINDLRSKILEDEVLTWAAFFLPDLFKDVKDARLQNPLNMRGTRVTPVSFTIDAQRNKTGILYIDPSTGIARGASFKAVRGGDSSEVVVNAREVELNAGVTADVFAFKPPAGAKKVEISAADLAKWYSTVDEGLKVAQATNRLVFVDFGAVW